MMDSELLIQHYQTGPALFDEMQQGGNIRLPYQKLVDTIREHSIDDLHLKHKLAGELFMNQGITFTVYSDDAGIERILIGYLVIWWREVLWQWLRILLRGAVIWCANLIHQRVSIRICGRMIKYKWQS